MKFIISILAFVLATTVVIAQNSFQNLINVSTTSPEAASIGKFGNIPVSYSTGVPNISVPVYEINIGKIKLPVSLDYHAGGIRVDEVASSVGLGWALNGVGVVSRNMVGRPDESTEGYLNSPSFDSLYTWHHDRTDYGTSIETKYARYLVSWTMYHEKETEPDVFSYTINGQSGKFIFKKDGSIMQIPKTNNRIVKTGNDFTITDENGVVYIFDQKETTEYVGASTTPYYTSTWRLSKMIDANTQDTIYFIYEGACDVNVTRYENFGHSLGYAGDCGNNNISQFGPTYTPSTVNHHNELFPKEIVWRGGKISFNNTCGRQDKASEKRLDEINIYADQNSQLTLIKRIKLFQSYFFSDPIPYGTVDEKNYRLRLDSVGFMSTSNAEAYYYRMTYNTSQPMAPRQSYAQDKWGFNNGQFGNSSLMPTQTVPYYGTYYTIGAANRDADAQAMQACTINSIEYPTKGKTVFEFEPHKYNDITTFYENKSVQCDAYGSMQQTSTATFIVDEHTEGYRFTVNISSYNYPGVSDRPRVRITDVTTGQLVTLITNMDPYNSYSSGTLALNVTMGHTYSIETNIYTNNSNVYATANISWVKTYVDVPIEPIGGGLRVKTVANYDLNGNFINKDIYKYNENGIGKLLTDAQYLAINYEIVKWRCGPSSIPCMFHMSPTEGYIYHANSVYPATQFSGSPVLYNKVTKSQVNAAGNAINGKSCYYYDIIDDWPAYASSDYGRIGVLLIDNGWKNGFLKVQEDYRYNSVSLAYDLVHKKENNYQVYRADTMMGLKITTRTIWLGGCYTDPDLEWAYERFKLFRIPTYSGAMLLQSTKETTWDDNNNKLVTTQNYFYNDQRHLMTTKVESFTSKGETNTDNFKYPYDFSSSGNVYQKMVDRNIISPVVEEQKLLNSVQQSLATIHYTDWFSDTKLLLPQKSDQQITTNAVETKIRFNKFDRYGNILQQQKENDIFQSYIWDYKSVYPVAQCTNADYNSIGYTSFEADGAGNWNIGSTSRVSNGMTGKRSYSLTNGTISKSDLDASQVYLISYWSTGGAYTVSGNTGNVVQGKTVNVNGVNWTYYQHEATGVTTVTISGNGNIDELRLHPKNARMATFAYEPLTGMTAKCDEGNHITYFEYDGFGRLSLVRDEDRNILKKLCYSYAGQQEAAGCSWVGNTPQSQTFTRNNCGSGYVGANVAYTVQAGTYFAPTVAEANQLALNAISANGQNYANTQGACLPIYYNTVKSGAFTKNNCSPGGIGSAVTYSVTAGTYSSTISQAAADQLAQDDVNANGQNYANSNGYCTWYSAAKSGTFIRNNCGSGYSGSSVTYNVASGAYNSTISQADADQKAQNDVNNNGQAYANNNGTCTAAFASVYASNWTSMSFTASFTNTSTNTTYNFSISPGMSSNYRGQVPAGTYNVNISPGGGSMLYEWWVDSYYTAGHNTFTLSGMSVASSFDIVIADY